PHIRSDSRTASPFYLMPSMSDHHIVLSYGDVFRQSGYRTKVLGQLLEYEAKGPFKPVLIAFDRDASELAKLDLGVEIYAHGRRDLLKYYADLRRIANQGRIRIVHAHNLYSGAMALSARWLFGYKVLVEIHGRIPEEYVILGKGGRLSHWLLKRLESWVMRSADHIIPISEKLREFLIGEYSLKPTKLTVIPACPRPRAFQWNPAVREATRTRLGLKDKFICVHLGSVFIWYHPDLIVKVFETVRTRTATAHLLVVTEDVGRTLEFLRQRLPEGLYTVL